MKIRIMLLFALLAMYRYAAAADEHAGHAAPSSANESDAAQAIHDHGAATDQVTEETAIHQHEAAAPAQVSALPRDDSAEMQEARHMAMMMHGDTINANRCREALDAMRSVVEYLYTTEG